MTCIFPFFYVMPTSGTLFAFLDNLNLFKSFQIIPYLNIYYFRTNDHELFVTGK